MRNYPLIIFILLASLLFSCQQQIKNKDAELKDEIHNTDSLVSPILEKPEANNNLIIKNEKDLIGYWVGYFMNAEVDDSAKHAKAIIKDEGLYWGRENKINISINELTDGKVFGHSVVAGNFRPFEGTYTFQNNVYTFTVKEPGDNRYDGKFDFAIALGDSILSGEWEAFKNIDIKKRNYELEKKTYHYNPNQNLDLERGRRYANWYKEIKSKKTEQFDDEDEIYEYISSEFETATEKIYEINASNSKLTKQDVENLKQGDLYIIRNTIYARHGYSFKDRPLRVFFDAQNWYIPVHNNIKDDFTPVEKENIKLLMKYEKNAKAYYDTFGRG